MRFELSMHETNMLEIVKVSKTFSQPDGNVKVLDQVNFDLPSGASAALLGESGSGKSTLLHLIAGLDKPNSGDIFINGALVSSFSDRQWNALRRSDLSLIFQQFHLIPTLDVMDNIQLQSRLAGAVDQELLVYLITRLGLGGLSKRLPHQLSGGQQQRVAIARALLHRPNLVLADEPTGNLDGETSRSVIQLLLELTRETGSGLLIVTHSQEMAGYMDHRWRLSGGCLTRHSNASLEN